MCVLCIVVFQSLGCVQLFCNHMNCSPQDFSAHGISQVGILEWVAISFSRGSSWLRDETCISWIAGGFSYHWATLCCIYTYVNRPFIVYVTHTLLGLYLVNTLKSCTQNPGMKALEVAQLVKNPLANARDARDRRFDLWVGKIPWRRKWQPASVFLLGKFHEERSLVGYSPWGPK